MSERIPKGWKKVKLGEYIKVKHGYAFKGKYITNEETDTILVTPGNFKIGGGFKSSKFKYYNSEYPEEYVLTEGDIVVTMTDLSKESDTLGYSAKIPSIKNKILLHNQRIGLVEFKNNEVSKEFIYWLMRTPEYHWYCVSSASGTSIMHTSPSRIENYEFYLPPFPEQKAIASVLSSLDDKIDLLHRQNKTLEQMAETLFRQWFIEEAKEDWEEKYLREYFNLLGGFAFKSKEYLDFGKYKIITIKCVQDGYLDISSAPTIEILPEKIKLYQILDIADILMSLTGNVGRVCLVDENNCLLNQRVAKIVPKNPDWKPFAYFYFKRPEMIQKLTNLSKGSAQLNLSPVETLKQTDTFPTKDKIDQFNKIVQPFFEKIIINKLQSRTLEKLRDNLLPKLMSGEVRLRL